MKKDRDKSNRKSALKQSSKRRKTGINAFIFVLASLFLAAIFLISSPKNTVIEVGATVQRLSFNLSEETSNGEEISILYSGLWTNEIRIEKFQRIKLLINALNVSGRSRSFDNPLFITSSPSNHGKITFISSSANISLQDITCTSGSRVNLEHNGAYSYLMIYESSQSPCLTLSFDEDITMSAQGCTVIDGGGRDFTQLFNDSVEVKLHDLSRSLVIGGVDSALQMHIKRDKSDNNAKSDYIIEQNIENLDLSKEIFWNNKMIKQSTIDSLFIIKSFPPDSLSYKSSDIGDLEIVPVPNKFIIYNLSEVANGFKVRGQGRFKSLTIGRGALKQEMVPVYLYWIEQNPTISRIVSLIVWIVRLIQLILPFKNKREVGDD